MSLFPPVINDRIADLQDRARDIFTGFFNHPVSGPNRRVWSKRIAIGAGVAALIYGVWIVFPRSQPDYLRDDLDEIFDYTLLSDDFNSLPLEERLRLLGQLIERMKGMSSEDSLLMAAFAAGIAGEARKQLEENASRMAIDIWDKYAVDYRNVPEDDREQYLERTFVEFTKMMETMAGANSGVSDEDRIKEMKKQAASERDRMTAPGGPKPPGQALGMVYDIMNNGVGGYASPQQKVRGAQMMRDMMRHFRGQDPETGKRNGPG